MPKKSFASYNESCEGSKDFKDFFLILLCASLLGEKIGFGKGHSNRPRALKNIKTPDLPVVGGQTSKYGH